MASILFSDAARLLGRGETGWRRLRIIDEVCFRDPFVGTTLELGRRTDEYREEQLRDGVGSKRRRNAKEQGRHERRIGKYERKVSDHAIQERTRKSMNYLESVGLITRRASNVGVQVRPASGVRIGKVKGVPSKLIVPQLILDRLIGTHVSPTPSTHVSPTPSTHYSPGQTWVPEGETWVETWVPDGPNVGAEEGETWVDSGETWVKQARNKEVGDLGGTIGGLIGENGGFSSNKLEEPRPPAGSDRNSISKPTSGGDPFGLLDGSGCSNDADAWLTSPGVPPYPSEAVVGAVVRVPPPPEVRPEMSIDERLALLAAAWKAVVRHEWRSRDPEWVPPSPRWWSFPKAPKKGEVPSESAQLLLECAKLFEKHLVPPHVWVMHRVRAWLETTNVGLDKPPPRKYVYDPAKIRQQRGWVRGLSDNIARARTETAPKARGIVRRWTAMRAEFFVRRVSSAAEAAEVAAAFFPPGEFDRQCEEARAEAQAMTEMHAEAIDEGRWVW